MAQELAAALEADPFGGEAIIKPIREQITAEVQAGINAAEADSSVHSPQCEATPGKVCCLSEAVC